MENTSWITWFYDPIHLVLVFGIIILSLVYRSFLLSEQIINLYRERLGLEPLSSALFNPLVTVKTWFKDIYSAAIGRSRIPNDYSEPVLVTIPGHEYDGIRELDNKLPPWWVWGFYISIFWGVVYLFYYHVLPATPLQDNEFASEMKVLEAARTRFLAEAKLKVDENSVTKLTDEVSLEAGRGIYQGKCAACHAADGGGLVGPNLTDSYWIHGGGIKDIFRTISQGVPEKGMIAWKDQLNPLQIQQVSSYIATLHGTTPAVAKDPQGTIWLEEVNQQLP